jgi:hypothetical protein
VQRFGQRGVELLYLPRAKPGYGAVKAASGTVVDKFGIGTFLKIAKNKEERK